MKSVLAMFTDEILDAFEARRPAAAGEIRLRVDRPSGEVFRSASRRQVHNLQTPDRTNRSAHDRRRRPDSPCACASISRTGRSDLDSSCGNSRHVGRRRRNLFAEHTLHHPIAALHRTGPQSRRVLGQKNRHRQQPAAAIVVGIVHADPFVIVSPNRGHAVVFARAPDSQKCICRTSDRESAGHSGSRLRETGSVPRTSPPAVRC